MATIVNTAQAEAWNGYEGGHWARHQARYDAVSSGFNDTVLTAVRPGDRVLDVGCGTGQLTRLVARRAAPGHALGLDLSAPMLDRARSTAVAEGLANVRFAQGDAQVHPLPAAAFDLVVSRFGVMFFADPVAAFANVGRALRPGGRLAVLCMDAIERSELGEVLAAFAAHLPPRPDEPGAPGPLSLADPAVTRRVLTDAGFTAVSTTLVEATQVWGRDAVDAGTFLAAWGPLRFHLEHVAPDAASRARAALVEAMRRYDSGGAVRLRATAWLVTARWDG